MLIENDGYGNTRLELESTLYTHCDYLRISVSQYTVERFESLLTFLAPKHNHHLETPWSPGAGAVWFAHRVSAIKGLVGGWTLDDKGELTAMLDLPGEYWEQCTPEGQWRIFRGLNYTYNVRCNRIDIAIDDPSYEMIPVENMREAYHNQHNFHFRKYRQHATYEDSGEKPFVTDEFGSRNSGKFVRVYDHDRKCLRFEAEFKRGYAPEAFKILSSLERSESHYSITSIDDEPLTEQDMSDEWNLAIQRVMAGIAVGAIDFRDRGKHKSASGIGIRDSKRLAFYQEFIDYLSTKTFRVKLPELARTASKSYEWIKRQCSASLAMWKEALGSADFFVWINQLLEFGRPRMDRLKFQWAEEIGRNKHKYKIT